MAITIDVNDIWKIYDVGEEKIEALKSVNIKKKKGSLRCWV